MQALVCFAVVLGAASVGAAASAALACSVCECGEPPAPCGPSNEECGPPFPGSAPRFHPRDTSCAMNDPNFPFFYDGVYHLMYQKHAAEPHANGDGRGPVIGHVVSADLVHWAHLPVALWNSAISDTVAVFTGSATLVDGVPVLIYPGICDPTVWAPCAGHNINLAAAIPANLTDPLLVSWVKRAPIVNSSQRDPTTAWRTAGGEWRFTNYDGDVFASADFSAWRVAGHLFPAGECPDVYPLPPLCAGEGCAGPPPAPLGGLPTHVHKLSTGGQDFYWLGNLSDGPPGGPGVWAPAPGLPPRGQALDGSAVAAAGGRPHTGPLYASKSFWDAPAARRVTWGWVSGGAGSAQTARVTTAHAGLGQLLFSPLPELAALRQQPPLFSASVPLRVAPGAPVWLAAGWPLGAGNASELQATFALPPSGAPARWGVAVNAGDAGGGGAWGVGLAVDFDPSSRGCNLSVAWPGGGAPVPLAILPGDAALEVRVFVDGAFFEVYVAGGRRALTHALPPANMSATAGAFLWATAGEVDAANVSVWAMGSIWVSAEEVLRQREALRGGRLSMVSM